MAECLITQLCKVIGKNGEIVYSTVFGSGRIEVRPRPGTPNEFDLWFLPAWRAPEVSP